VLRLPARTVSSGAAVSAPSASIPLAPPFGPTRPTAWSHPASRRFWCVTAATVTPRRQSCRRR